MPKDKDQNENFDARAPPKGPPVHHFSLLAHPAASPRHSPLLSDRFVPLRRDQARTFWIEDEPQNKDASEYGVKISKLYKRVVLQEPSSHDSARHRFLQFKESAPEPCSFQHLRDCSFDSLKTRKFPKYAAKVLDAPALQDDFYLNLIDWGSQNMLSVGLGGCTYLWNASTNKVDKLFQARNGEHITSVGWSKHSSLLGVGTSLGQTQIWDIVKMAHVDTKLGHSKRVCSLSWANSFAFATGSRDKTILLHDVRQHCHYHQRLIGHKQEVCGLSWSNDQQQLASGGNDNKLMVWGSRSNKPELWLKEHTAAVKAIAWSPHKHGLLASGGGTADRKICFWNTVEGRLTDRISTDSQVCNLIFSKTNLISTHGYSLNDICVWSKELRKEATFTGHSYRVLYLAMNPEGTTIVTGAGDETIRFWNVFEATPQPQLDGREVVLR